MVSLLLLLYSVKERKDCYFLRSAESDESAKTEVVSARKKVREREERRAFLKYREQKRQGLGEELEWAEAGRR